MYIYHYRTDTVNDKHQLFLKIGGVSKETYTLLLKNVNGIPKEQATEMLNKCGLIQHYLFDVDKFHPDHSSKANNFTGYNRVFAGPGAPLVDETYEEIISPDINY